MGALGGAGLLGKVHGSPRQPTPPGLAETELFAVDAYRTEFDATVTEVDREGGRVALARTAFYPVGGGQPSDTGTLRTPAGPLVVTGVRREHGAIWHTVAGGGAARMSAPRCRASWTGSGGTG